MGLLKLGMEDSRPLTPHQRSTKHSNSTGTLSDRSSRFDSLLVPCCCYNKEKSSHKLIVIVFNLPFFFLLLPPLPSPTIWLSRYFTLSSIEVPSVRNDLRSLPRKRRPCRVFLPALPHPDVLHPLQNRSFFLLYSSAFPWYRFPFSHL